MLLHDVIEGAYVARSQGAIDRNWLPHNEVHWPGVVVGNHKSSSGKDVVQFLIYHYQGGWSVHSWDVNNLEAVSWE